MAHWSAIDTPPAGLILRLRTPADLPFLRTLYASTRALEMALVPWPTDAKAAFLDDQFALQDAHFKRTYRHADLIIVEKATPLAKRAPIGRVSLDRKGKSWRLIDISLMPQERGKGHGGDLLRWLQAEARIAGATIDLHVLRDNMRAAALYRKLGFIDAASDTATHDRMQWAPAPLS